MAKDHKITDSGLTVLCPEGCAQSLADGLMAHVKTWSKEDVAQ